MALHYDGEIKVKKLALGPYDNNVYVVICPETNESVIVDGAAEADKILAAVEGTKVRYILQTHGHPDHIAALDDLRAALQVPVGIHKDDAAMLKTPPDFLIADDDVIRFGKRVLQAIHTPGHTPGGLCFRHSPVLFSGDTLFPGGPGATAHPLGNFPQIIESIRTRLFVLPDNTIVMPGHGLDTTIGTERPSLDEWIARGW
jgi:glyoxylase-like metal-dependent hydrolase (beta-lactamase superfamily II)